MGSLNSASQINALVAAAGAGSRMGAQVPKQYLALAGEAVIDRSIHTLLSLAAVNSVVVSIAADDQHWQRTKLATNPAVTPVTGGENRALSVLAGLQHLLKTASADSWVLIHDAARPLVLKTDIERLISEVSDSGACGGILAVPVVDTIKQAVAGPAEQGKLIESTPARERLWQAQTPQLFPLRLLYDTMQAALENGIALTDEASALEAAGQAPLLVQGHMDNIKITHAVDIALAEWLLARQCQHDPESLE